MWCIDDAAIKGLNLGKRCIYCLKLSFSWVMIKAIVLNCFTASKSQKMNWDTVRRYLDKVQAEK